MVLMQNPFFVFLYKYYVCAYNSSHFRGMNLQQCMHRLVEKSFVVCNLESLYENQITSTILLFVVTNVLFLTKPQSQNNLLCNITLQVKSRTYIKSQHRLNSQFEAFIKWIYIFGFYLQSLFQVLNLYICVTVLCHMCNKPTKQCA